ncbi:MAG: hypothetical protein IJQ29_03780, partial [Synergistaceae bacterium]|nr:hypothetical protein [Synergistaceae bacterium]
MKIFALLNKARILLWVFLLIAVGCLVGFQVMAKLRQAEANLRSLEVSELPVYPVETEKLKAGSWETWRSYYGQAKSA